MEHKETIVRFHLEDGLSERQIARLLKIPSSTVHYWLLRERSQRHSDTEVLKRGRPRITDSNLDVAIYNASQQNPFLTAVDIQETVAPECSIHTVRKRLKEKGLKCRVPARKPFLKPVHIEKRLAFAINHIEWSIDRWHQVVFSDEKIFRASYRGPLRVYRPTDRSYRFDEKYITPSTNPGGRFRIHVWMAFGGRGTIRIIHRVVRKSLNNIYYVRRILPLIEDDIVDNDLIFMHDQSSVHTSKNVKRWLTQHNIPVMHDWPPKGPDMNPVENIWAELVRLVRRDSTNKNELWENVMEAFEKLTDNYYNTLVESMNRRISSVLMQRGRWTKY